MKLELDIPAGTMSALKREPVEFLADLRIAAAAKWYETGQLSQEKAAELAGLDRQHFLAAISRLKVTPFQASLDELIAEGAL